MPFRDEPPEDKAAEVGVRPCRVNRRSSARAGLGPGNRPRDLAAVWAGLGLGGGGGARFLGYGGADPSAVDEKGMLKERLSVLESALAAVKKRLGDLEQGGE